MPRLATLVCVVMLASACGSDTVPSPPALLSPSPTPLRMTSVEALVLDKPQGPCIGATVEVVGGQSLGKKSMTILNMCDTWGDSNGGEAKFSDLIPDVPMTLRASAAGYRAQEMTVVPSWPGNRVTFVLSR
jgi:hypothetical protein